MFEETLEQKLSEFSNFPITIDRREVSTLMERYEARNTRLLIDVNEGADDIVTGNKDASDKGQALQQKLNHVKETIAILKVRKVEAA